MIIDRLFDWVWREVRGSEGQEGCVCCWLGPPGATRQAREPER